MSKKAAKPKAAVYDCPEEEQVDLLAQALLREYMHRRQHSQTLASFDEEQPRTEKTVSSRAVMYDLMALAEAMPGMKERGIETIMEALCCMRVEKREEVEAVAGLRSELAALRQEEAALEAQLASYEADSEALIAEARAKAAAAAPEKVKKDKADKKKKKAAASSGEEADAEKKAKKEKKKAKKAAGGEAEKAAKKAKKAKGDGPRLMSIDELLENDDDVERARREQQRRRSSAEPSPTSATSPGADDKADADGGSSSSSEEGSSAPSEDEDDYGAAVRRIRDEQQRAQPSGGAAAASSSTGSAWGGTFEAADDMDPSPGRLVPGDASSSSSPPGRVSAGSSHGKPHHASESPARRVPGNDELGDDAASQLLVCLAGEKRGIPNSFQCHGWYAPDEPGTPSYGLEQRQGGPCGVLAVVQARLAQRFLSSSSPTQGDFSRSLVSALAATIAVAAGRSHEAVVIRPPVPEADTSQGRPVTTVSKQRAWLATFRRVHVPNSHAAISKLIGGLPADEWLRPDGAGLLCLVLSCVLSRGGVDKCRTDMDFPASLIVEHGYCSQEITNLLLCGTCHSNCTDGEQDVDGVKLRGYHAPLDVGFLSSMEVKGHMRVGALAKYPSGAAPGEKSLGVPAWVVYNESHYSVLLSQGTGLSALKPQSSASGEGRFAGFPAPQGGEEITADLYYYDQQGQQTEDVRLTLTVSKMPLPAQRRDAVIPFLDAMVRTVPQWANARVNWNGTDPLL